jgi:hypothetical protein
MGAASLVVAGVMGMLFFKPEPDVSVVTAAEYAEALEP